MSAGRRVGLEPVRSLRGAECVVERGDVRRRDAGVVTSEQTEDRRAHAFRLLRRHRPGLVLAFAKPPIEPDDPGETRHIRRGEERDPSAKTEAENEKATRWGLLLDFRLARGDVGEHALRGRLPDMRHVIEVVGAPSGPRRSPEEVEGDRVHTGRREPFRELLVERVQAADVGRDDNAGVPSGCAREIRADLRPVRARHHDILSTRPTGHRRQQVERNIGRAGARRITHGGPPGNGFRMLAQDG